MWATDLMVLCEPTDQVNWNSVNDTDEGLAVELVSQTFSHKHMPFRPVTDGGLLHP